MESKTGSTSDSKLPMYCVSDDLGRPITNTSLNGSIYLSWNCVVVRFIRVKKMPKLHTDDPPYSTDPAFDFFNQYRYIYFIFKIK